jgi:hypothetical protein
MKHKKRRRDSQAFIRICHGMYGWDEKREIEMGKQAVKRWKQKTRRWRREGRTKDEDARSREEKKGELRGYIRKEPTIKIENTVKFSAGNERSRYLKCRAVEMRRQRRHESESNERGTHARQEPGRTRVSRSARAMALGWAGEMSKSASRQMQ